MTATTDPTAGWHRLLTMTGAGWYRRKRWVKHEPQWSVIAEGDGKALMCCIGDPRCMELRIHDGTKVLASGSRQRPDKLLSDAEGLGWSQ